jgi:DNA-binding NarL/FixJ family response regulator
MDTIRILLVEDQTLMRQGLRTIIELEPDMQVAGEAANGVEAVSLALSLRPQIVLMDVQLPGMTGVEATAAVCAAWPEAKIIILTTFDRNDYVFQAVRAGAAGFLLKDTPADHLLQIIRKVHAGEDFIQPEIAARALRELVRPNEPAPEPLSEREHEVLVLLAQGLANRDIAEKLVLSEGTVKNHVSSILGKLRAANRTEAADIARRRGLA